jgi:serine/threonine protein kinase
MAKLVEGVLAQELDGGPVVHRDLKPANVLAKPHGPAPKRGDGYRSKAEADYAAWVDSLPRVSWSYERLTVACQGKRTRYKPDFRVTSPYALPGWLEGWSEETCGRIYVEVKGTKDGERPFWRDGARRRALDGAAALRVETGLPLYVAWRVDGMWQHELVPVRS